MQIKQKWKSYLKRIMLIVIVFLIFWHAVRVVTLTDKNFQYLNSIINENIANSFQSEKVFEMNREWELGFLAISSFAITNKAFIDSTYKDTAIELNEILIKEMLSKRIQDSYGFKGFDNLDFKGNPDESVIYTGYLNYMLSTYNLLTNDNEEILNINAKVSEYLYEQYRNSSTKFLESYTGNCWTGDNVIALASLKFYDLHAHTNYSIVCDQWVSSVKDNFLDKDGLMTSEVFLDYNDKKCLGYKATEGSTINWSTMFIRHFDEEFAKEQYYRFRKKYSTNFGLLRAFKENSPELDYFSEGNIDSGPIIFNYGSSATVFGYGAARAVGDSGTYKSIKLILPLFFKRADIGFKSMVYSPLSDAIFSFCAFQTKLDSRYLKPE